MDVYYYLNESKEPQGPHTLDELRALLAVGKLQPDTLAAHRGAANWVTLAELLAPSAEPVELPAFPAAPSAGKCPACTHGLTAPDGKLPERCPSCGYRLRALNIHDLWQNFVLALRKSFVLRGRAPRIEYWSFVLFSTLITTVLITIMQVALVAMLPTEAVTALESPETANELDALPSTAMTAMLVMGGVYFLVNLAVMVPQLTVTVRRMHDAGYSGKWLLLYALLCVICIWGAVSLEGSDGNMQTITFVGILLSFLLIFALFIFFFILTLLDSNRGPNKYGPSPKYPLA